jgi:hypothetical protein
MEKGAEGTPSIKFICSASESETNTKFMHFGKKRLHCLNLLRLTSVDFAVRNISQVVGP